MTKRKIIATCVTAGMAMAALSAVSVSASAASVIDFEDGNYSFVSMKTDDGGDDSELSVVDFNGSKQLKVAVKDCTLIPKVKFDINAILGDDNMEGVKTIEMDVTFESKDGTTPPGWAGGAIGTQGGESGTPEWGQTSWDGGEYDKGISEPLTIQRKFLLPSEKFVNGTPDTHMLLMRWACDVDYNMYIDNIRFLDGSGNEIELALTASAPAQEETTAVEEPAAVEETTAEPAPEETTPAETAPASDEDTTSTTTGNASTVAAATALVLASYGVFMTRKKK